MKANAKVCPLCDDTGWKSVGEGQERRVTRCDCRNAVRAERWFQRFRIPERYKSCSFGTFRTDDNNSARLALLKAQRLVEDYPIDKKGLLLIGPVGVGKTHLAVSIIRELGNKGIACLFYEYGELLTIIRHSYNPQVAHTEMDVLRPVVQAEVLVIDDLGAQRVSDWVWDILGHIINTRYNENRTTILTTNFANKPARRSHEPTNLLEHAKKATSEETLGDRITERLRSRLHEMCRIVELDGSDHRIPKRLNGVTNGNAPTSKV